MNYWKLADTEENTSSYLYLSPLRIRNPLTPPSINRGNLNIFLKTLQKTFQFKLKLKFKLKFNSIHKFSIQIPNFKSPATFQINKKVNKKVNIKN
jgi:hypothetical protein